VAVAMIGRVLRTGLSRLRRLAAARLAPTGFNPSRIEFRPDSRGNFDELVARFKDGFVFFEDLGENGLYVEFSWNDGRYCQFWAAAKRGKLAYNHEEGWG
jgi:hypothetical protein